MYKRVIDDDIEIMYTESDAKYIDKLVSYFEKNYKKIMYFFGIKKLDKPFKIMLWNDSKKFREEMSKITGYLYPIWATGSAKNDKTDFFSRVDYLSLSEIKKIDYHKSETLLDLFKGIIHEFVHVCHSQACNYNYPKESYKTEGVATFLANQYLDAKITVPLETILKDEDYVEYSNYRAIFNYLVRILSREELLDFISKSDEHKEKDIFSIIAINEYQNSSHSRKR